MYSTHSLIYDPPHCLRLTGVRILKIIARPQFYLQPVDGFTSYIIFLFLLFVCPTCASRIILGPTTRAPGTERRKKQPHYRESSRFSGILGTSVAIRMMDYSIALLIFTALHGMQTRSSDENSVCLSKAWIVTKRKNCPDFYTIQKTI